MSLSGITQYVVTFRYRETSLTRLLELSSAMVSAGFTTTLNDAQGHPHKLGSNNFGIVSALSAEALQAQAVSLGELVLDLRPEVEITTLEAFNQREQR